MNAIDYILDGLEAELALERELGVRTIEIDRSLLAPPAPPPATVPAPASAPAPAARPQPVAAPSVAGRTPTRPSTPAPASVRQPAASGAPLDFVFLHDRPLSAAGSEMMAKIVAALGRTSETAPIIQDPPAPPARLRIVLGSRALKKWFPGVNAGPGQWFTDEKGDEVLVTYTPEFFLRYKTVTPAVVKIKQEMWTSLKSVLKKL